MTEHHTLLVSVLLVVAEGEEGGITRGTSTANEKGTGATRFKRGKEIQDEQKAEQKAEAEEGETKTRNQGSTLSEQHITRATRLPPCGRRCSLLLPVLGSLTVGCNVIRHVDQWLSCVFIHDAQEHLELTVAAFCCLLLSQGSESVTRQPDN